MTERMFPPTSPRHCERSEAIQGNEESLDCRVARAPRNDVERWLSDQERLVIANTLIHFRLASRPAGLHQIEMLLDLAERGCECLAFLGREA